MRSFTKIACIIKTKLRLKLPGGPKTGETCQCIGNTLQLRAIWVRCLTRRSSGRNADDILVRVWVSPTPRSECNIYQVRFWTLGVIVLYYCSVFILKVSESTAFVSPMISPLFIDAYGNHHSGELNRVLLYPYKWQSPRLRKRSIFYLQNLTEIKTQALKCVDSSTSQATLRPMHVWYMSEMRTLGSAGADGGGEWAWARWSWDSVSSRKLLINE